MAKYLVSPSPHVHAATSTRSIMIDVLIALLPAVLVSVVFYGWYSLLLLVVSVASCVLVELLITSTLLKRPSTISDCSAIVTGVLLAMNLPPSTPLYIVVIGAIVAIGIAKMTFGGLGQNIFNPAITARIFLLVSFPVQMTNWSIPTSFVPGVVSQVDAVSGATPLSVLKEALKAGVPVEDYIAQSGLTAPGLLSDIGASMGEVSSIALLLGFVYLLIRKVVKAWIPLSIFATVAIISFVFNAIDPVYSGPVFNIFTGGMVLGACFMATDYVTSPMSNLGGVIYGIGIGIIVMMIRYFGAYPEGVSFAILIMNCVVPLINKFCHQRKFGRA